VLEIDGASNNSVEEVRELRSNIQFRPSRSRHKIYIIDEVHMLSKAAFNALLKTLEEPPPHVKFIFATTEVEKIPITILSRCQRFDFAGIGTPRIVQRLREIVASEGMQADDEALETLARRAGGSMRDAQSLLDQLLAFGGERLTVEHVHRLLGTASDERVSELAAAVLGRDPKRALELFGKAVDEGLQLGELVDQLIGYWRDLMVVNAAGPQAPAIGVGSKQRATLEAQAKSRTLDTLLAGLDVLSSTRARLRTSNQGRVLVEMALVRLGQLDDLVSLSQLAQAAAGQSPAPSSAAPVSAASATVPKKKPLTDSESQPVSATQAPGPATGAIELTADTLASIWKQVLAQLGPIMSHALEKAGLPAISGPNTLVLRFPEEYNATRDRCQDPENVGRLEQLLQQLTGRKWRLQITSVGVVPDPSARIAEVPDSSQSRLPLPRDEVAEPPLVQWTRNLLGAQPIKADPGFGASSGAWEERADQIDTEEP
jgi:DNA polymerase III subunit gamma/tau